MVGQAASPGPEALTDVGLRRATARRRTPRVISSKGHHEHQTLCHTSDLDHAQDGARRLHRLLRWCLVKAARFNGPKDIDINDVPVPVLRPGAVTIDIAWCGICGTDLHEYLEGPIFIPAKGHPHPLTHEEEPVTMGHEFSGTDLGAGGGRHRPDRRRERRRRALLRLRRVRALHGGSLQPLHQDGLHRAGRRGRRPQREDRRRPALGPSRRRHPARRGRAHRAALGRSPRLRPQRRQGAATSPSSAGPAPSACCSPPCSRPRASP